MFGFTLNIVFFFMLFEIIRFAVFLCNIKDGLSSFE